MTPDLAELKYQVHAARVALDYQRKTQRPERGGSREEQIANAQARLDAAQKAYRDAQPEPVSLRPRSPYFIGPRRKKGKRGDGPTIKCFRCQQVKAREHFYERGTLCIECIVKRSAEWAKKNPERAVELWRNWARSNRDKIREKSKKHYWENREQELLRKREYNRKNTGKRTNQQKQYIKKRKLLDPKFRALLTCKRRMWILFKSAGVKKTLRSAELLGIDRAGFFAHLESLFLPGMTWQNRGRGRGFWHIDHIVPCASFDMTDPEQAKKCWHYTNLQPLWAEDNWAKSDKIIPLTMREAGGLVVSVTGEKSLA